MAQQSNDNDRHYHPGTAYTVLEVNGSSVFVWEKLLLPGMIIRSDSRQFPFEGETDDIIDDKLITEMDHTPTLPNLLLGFPSNNQRGDKRSAIIPVD